VGSNRRYADGVAAISVERMFERTIAEVGEPDSLHESELDLAHTPVTRSPVAREVVAWVRYGTHPVRVRATTHTWTPNAVAIQWPVPGGGTHRAWVWIGAIIDWVPPKPRKHLPVLGDHDIPE